MKREKGKKKESALKATPLFVPALLSRQRRRAQNRHRTCSRGSFYFFFTCSTDLDSFFCAALLIFIGDNAARWRRRERGRITNSKTPRETYRLSYRLPCRGRGAENIGVCLFSHIGRYMPRTRFLESIKRKTQRLKVREERRGGNYNLRCQ